MTTRASVVTKLATCLATRLTILPSSESGYGSLREALGWSQEQVGVAVGIDESSSRARISRYELGVHEPPVPTARLIANSLNAPLTYLYCEDDGIAALLLALHRLGAEQRLQIVQAFSTELDSLR